MGNTRGPAQCGRRDVALAAIGLAIMMSSCSAPSVVEIHGASRFSSSTASDWVANATHVVVASPRSESAIPATDAEAKRGEGVTFRNIRIHVDRVLWSTSRVNPEPAPSQFDWQRLESIFKDGKPEEQYVTVVEGEPRVEIGHRYIVAITWLGPTCGDGDPTIPARWVPLGEHSALPYDTDVIGEGELEGERVTAAETRERVAGRSPLLDAVVGQPAEALVAELERAVPGTPEPRDPTPTCAE